MIGVAIGGGIGWLMDVLKEGFAGHPAEEFDLIEDFGDGLDAAIAVVMLDLAAKIIVGETDAKTVPGATGNKSMGDQAAAPEPWGFIAILPDHRKHGKEIDSPGRFLVMV